MTGREMREVRRENAAPFLDVRVRVSMRTAKRVPSSLFSLPIVVAILALVSCDPTTTRPDLTPFPETRTIEVLGDRDSALAILRYALTVDSFPIARVSTRDHWLESPWFDARTLAPAGTQTLGAGVVKLRGWADPSRQGATLLIVELVFRPMVDPSVPARELERPVPATDSVYARVGRVLKLVEDSVGAHFGDKPRH